MEYEDKLVEFIDGEIPEEEERELFSMISMDDSLRGEYKNLLAITNTIKASAGIYSPSTELKASVYSDLNISTPAKHTPVPAKFMQGTKWHLLSGGIGALLATSVFMISTNFFSNDNNQPKPSIINQSAVAQQIESQNGELKNDKVSFRNNNQNFITNDNNMNDKSKMETLQDENNSMLLAISEPRYSARINFRTDENLKFGKLDNSDISLESDNHNIQKDDAIDLSIEAGWSLNWNLPKETIQPAKMNEFNNLGIELFFNVVQNFDFGISVRQETFFTRYEEQFSNNQILKYEQNPNLTSYGITFRQRFLNEKKLQPLAQINFVVNNYGIILRPSIGILYKINDSFSLVENLEYSNMLFTHDQTWFSASKIGLKFGINYKF